MGSPTAWLLNFESDEELAIGGTFTPSGRLTRELTRLREAHARHVLGPNDCELGEGCEEMLAEAWCPTPSALLRIRKARAIPPEAPEFEVLRRVNSREFCASLPDDDPLGRFVTNEADLLECIAQHQPSEGWLLKRNFGTSGRGQLKLAGQHPAGPELAWIASSWKTGGLRVEPFRMIDTEFTIHGWVGQDAISRIGDPCIQSTDANGAWLNTRLAEANELAEEERAALKASAERCASALAAAGYFGPFGLDAYRWTDGPGGTHLQARSEINARYTLGWRVGFGDCSTESA
jgi:hypothetical protein